MRLKLIRQKNESEGENIISGISYQEIIAMLQKLPPAYRTVFNLHVLEGYKHEEIAKHATHYCGDVKI
jgi:RNA polymerase sigma-70 factor (ECF subfamily)